MKPSSPTRICSVPLSVLAGFSARAADSGPPYHATGFKVGEVTDTSAIVWTRLTRHAEHNAPGRWIHSEINPASSFSPSQRLLNSIQACVTA